MIKLLFRIDKNVFSVFINTTTGSWEPLADRILKPHGSFIRYIVISKLYRKKEQFIDGKPQVGQA